jgi:shikimate kinase
MMGSGKSTIGRLLAEVTGWSYVDNDELVRRLHGATPRQLLADRGEAVMREAESAALALGLETPAPSIVGIAAGTILDPSNRERLRGGGIVVWLRAAGPALETRAIGGEHRPWLDSGGVAWIRETAAERDPLYASVAHITIDTDAGLPLDAASELLERLRAHVACVDHVPEKPLPSSVG